MMMYRWAAAFLLFATQIHGLHAAAQTSPAIRDALNTPVIVERSAPTTSIPLDVRGGKLHLTASVEGVEREFMFDTGSPTILTAELADQLGLEVIGQNTGVDANGTAVTMDIAIVGEISLGDVTFRNVPVFIQDYAQVPLGDCFFDGGVLGSELLPGSAWRIDLEHSRLDIAASAQDLGVATDAGQAPLHDFGYPHLPIVDYAIKGFEDKAMFDTGNAGAVVLYEKIASDRKARRAIVRGSAQQGRGSEGISAGGLGAPVDLQRFTLNDVRVGDVQLAPIHVRTRTIPPTLIGAGLLDRSIVTLDYPASMMFWEPRAAPPQRPSHQGFGVMFVEDIATVVQLFEDSPAHRAGLQLGDHVLEISGTSLTASDDTQRCERARWLATMSDREAPTTITVLRDGKALTLELD